MTNTLKDETSTREKIDVCLRGMNDILINEAQKCMKFTRSKPKRPLKKSKLKGFKWHNSECTNLKNRTQNQAQWVMKLTTSLNARMKLLKKLGLLYIH